MLILSALFSSSETGMMAINKYRLKHKANEGNKGAIKVLKLLESPDRLLGVILLGNNFVNIFASSIATVIAIELMGEAGIALAAGLLTLTVLIFSEVAPKTLAALYPERVAYPAAYILEPLLKILSPIIWFVNFFANSILAIFGIKVKDQTNDEHSLSHEELATLIKEATGKLPKQYRSMLTGIMQLERTSVEDVMIPKQDIYGIDVNLSIEKITKLIIKSPFTRIPVYRSSIDDELIGIINLKRILGVISNGELSLKDIVKLARPGYFIPETTTLNTQLNNFNHNKRKMGLIVDEYGNLQGLLTMEDLLEEIVGNLNTDTRTKSTIDAYREKEGSILSDATEFIRDINRTFEVELPTNGPKTLNGLIQETMETLPNLGTCIKIDNYCLEVTKISKHQIEQVKITIIKNLE
jgi:Mg2+/Co2+ transporter CorB